MYVVRTYNSWTLVINAISCERSRDGVYLEIFKNRNTPRENIDNNENAIINQAL